jgi:hypothetical protein
MKKRLIALGAATGCLVASAALAIEDVKISGFLTAGATYSPDPVLTGSHAVSQDGNIEDRWGFTNDSRLGIQLSAKVNPKVDITGQLLAKANDPDSDVKADWAFVTYKAADPVHIRAGKIKLPTFLISDYYEVGYAYPWVRPPQEVYFSNPISSIDGVDALIRFGIGESTLLIQPYYGVSRGASALVPQEIVTAFPLCPGPFPGSPCPAGTVAYADFTADKFRGINVSLGSDIFTVRAGYLKTLVSAPSFQVQDDEATFSSIGATLDWKNLVVYTEYFEREIKDAANMAFPNQKGYYATLGYRFGNFLPHITLASLDDNDNPPGGLAMGNGVPLKQESVTLGFRYELGTGAALKVEAQQVEPETGTRGLLVADPATGPNADDNVMIYSIAIDVVF